jgi:bis(5'-nucleosidyl)-tetraphosphatase
MIKKEHSYGVIPLKKEKGWKTLLVKHGAGHWAFPKGHPEGGEKPLETAARELKEETALEIVTFLPLPPFEEHYFFTAQGQKIEKWVTYFAAVVKGEVILQDSELEEYKWVTLSEAVKLITFAEGKRIGEKLKQYLM